MGCIGQVSSRGNTGVSTVWAPNACFPLLCALTEEPFRPQARIWFIKIYLCCFCSAVNNPLGHWRLCKPPPWFKAATWNETEALSLSEDSNPSQFLYCSPHSLMQMSKHWTKTQEQLSRLVPDKEGQASPYFSSTYYEVLCSVLNLIIHK